MSAAYRWQYEPARELALFCRDQALWRYHFATDRQKPYFHPLNTTDGMELSCFESWDHFWHRGLWFSWKFLNGLNYWEESHETGQSEGLTEFAGGEAVSFPSGRAAISTCLRYHPPGAPAIMEEFRETACHLPRADGSYIMDWRQTFSAREEPVVIDRTPITEKTTWGGYSGLSWRAARSLGNFHTIDSEGRKDEKVDHQRARWVDLSGASDGGPRLAAGLAIFDHPSNPRHPTHWYCLRQPGFGFINPALVMMEPYRLEPGVPLTLRYRVLTHSGWGEAKALEKEFENFASEK